MISSYTSKPSCWQWRSSRGATQSSRLGKMSGRLLTNSRTVEIARRQLKAPRAPSSSSSSLSSLCHAGGVVQATDWRAGAEGLLCGCPRHARQLWGCWLAGRQGAVRREVRMLWVMTKPGLPELSWTLGQLASLTYTE